MATIRVFMCVTSLLAGQVTANPIPGFRPRYGPPRPGVHAAGHHQGATRGIDWNQLAHEELNRALHTFPQMGVAKNVILFLGDGMGPSDVTATRIHLAQKRRSPVATTRLSFEEFPVTGLSKTHTSDRVTADSAGAATALLCGEKVNFYTVGVADTVQLYNCSALSEAAKLRSVLKHSMDKGKWTGIVTNTRVTHASPSAAYAHSADRNGEANIPLDTAIEPDKCMDIAQQLVTDPDNHGIRVVLGGGRQKLYPCNKDSKGSCTTGDRLDNRNLTEEWLQIKADAKLPEGSYKYITTADELNADLNDTEFLLGLFADSHMMFEDDRQQMPAAQQPSLSNMVEKAIHILQRGTDGFFLFVEGGLIDKAHHANLPRKALEETISLAEAVETAVRLTNQEDTLIVVTADHSHVFTIAGYSKLEDDILGTYVSEWEPTDGMPYTTLQYVNGPGFRKHRQVAGSLHQRLNLTGIDTTGGDFVFDAGLLIEDETHGGEDVAVYARGPMSHLLHGVHHQHYVAHAVRYAACVGPDPGVCGTKPSPGRGAARPRPPLAAAATAGLLVIMKLLC